MQIEHCLNFIEPLSLKKLNSLLENIPDELLFKPVTIKLDNIDTVYNCVDIYSYTGSVQDLALHLYVTEDPNKDKLIYAWLKNQVKAFLKGQATYMDKRGIVYKANETTKVYIAKNWDDGYLPLTMAKTKKLCVIADASGEVIDITKDENESFVFSIKTIEDGNIIAAPVKKLTVGTEDII